MSRLPSTFRLLDEHQVGIFKFEGREPRTLEELAIARADHEHRRRNAEIRSMRARLRMLDELLPQLAAQGIRLNRREIMSTDSGRTLRIQPPLFEFDDRLYSALLALGFKEVRRETTLSRYDMVTLQQGRWLFISIDVSKPAEVPAPAAPVMVWEPQGVPA